VSWRDDDPGQGDPDGILVASSDLAGIADLADSCSQQLHRLHDQLDPATWSGTTATAFRGRVGKLPDHLDHLRNSYRGAADSLQTYGLTVRDIQDQARAVKTQLQTAQSGHALAVAAQKSFLSPGRSGNWPASPEHSKPA
jgi:uncharacterized protein YukE